MIKQWVVMLVVLTGSFFMVACEGNTEEQVEKKAEKAFEVNHTSADDMKGKDAKN